MSVTDWVNARIAVHRALPEPARRAELRKAAGLTQLELAGILHVHRTTIAHWESGRSKPNGKLVDAYLEAIHALENAQETPRPAPEWDGTGRSDCEEST